MAIFASIIPTLAAGRPTLQHVKMVAGYKTVPPGISSSRTKQISFQEMVSHLSLFCSTLRCPTYMIKIIYLPISMNISTTIYDRSMFTFLILFSWLMNPSVTSYTCSENSCFILQLHGCAGSSRALSGSYLKHPVESARRSYCIHKSHVQNLSASSCG